jgi:hypothetical protein
MSFLPYSWQAFPCTWLGTRSRAWLSQEEIERLLESVAGARPGQEQEAPNPLYEAWLMS